MFSNGAIFLESRGALAATCATSAIGNSRWTSPGCPSPQKKGTGGLPLVHRPRWLTGSGEDCGTAEGDSRVFCPR